jgi:phosphoesterase RecJ-like protein
MEQLKELIDDAGNILVTSHISPDGDSVSSSLLLYQILKLNYPEKRILLSMEEEPYGLSFLMGYNEIKFQPLLTSLNEFSPSLLIVLDANILKRATRDPEPVRVYIQDHKPKLAIIDHHEDIGTEENNLYINNNSPAVTLDIYELFIQEMGLQKPEGYAQIALTGIYTDTGGFIHKSPNFEKVFEVIPKLIADGADIELTVNNLNKISEEGLAVLAELIANTKYNDNFTYSFISDETVSKASHDALVRATDVFRSEFLRNINDRPWGFIVYRDVKAPEHTYSVSLRSLSGAKDVSVIAAKLGGGGHKPAAGAKFSANGILEAVEGVLNAIGESSSS